jgi:hypothetical protein
VSDADPVAALDLAPGEQVLWQGRPGFGAPWPELRRVIRNFGIAWLAIGTLYGGLALVLALQGSVHGDPRRLRDALVYFALSVGEWTLVLLPLLVAQLLARVVGPYTISLAMLTIFGPLHAIGWAVLVGQHGWAGALERTPPAGFLFALVVLGLPLLRILVGVLGRLNVVYVLTGRRGAAVRLGARPRVLWEAPLVVDRRLQARPVRPWGWRGGRGHIAVGFGAERRMMSMVRDPDAAVAEARRAVEGQVESIKDRLAARRLAKASGRVPAPSTGAEAPPGPTPRPGA